MFTSHKETIFNSKNVIQVIIKLKNKKKKNIYERLGGQMAIDLAVDKFYSKMLSDPLLKEYFKSSDMKK